MNDGKAEDGDPVDIGVGRSVELFAEDVEVDLFPAVLRALEERRDLSGKERHPTGVPL